MAKQKKMEATQTTQGYEPGVCNIDPAGVRKRATFGIVLLAVTLAVWYYLKFILLGSWELQTLVFIPALFSFMGLWQAKLHFCMGNAKKRQYEIGGVVEAVTDEASVAKDKARASQIFTYAAICALVLTIILIII